MKVNVWNGYSSPISKHWRELSALLTQVASFTHSGTQRRVLLGELFRECIRLPCFYCLHIINKLC